MSDKINHVDIHYNVINVNATIVIITATSMLLPMLTHTEVIITKLSTDLEVGFLCNQHELFHRQMNTQIYW